MCPGPGGRRARPRDALGQEPRAAHRREPVVGAHQHGGRDADVRACRRGSPSRTWPRRTPTGPPRRCRRRRPPWPPRGRDGRGARPRRGVESRGPAASPAERGERPTPTGQGRRARGATAGRTSRQWPPARCPAHGHGRRRGAARRGPGSSCRPSSDRRARPRSPPTGVEHRHQIVAQAIGGHRSVPTVDRPWPRWSYSTTRWPSATRRRATAPRTPSPGPAVGEHDGGPIGRTGHQHVELSPVVGADRARLTIGQREPLGPARIISGGPRARTAPARTAHRPQAAAAPGDRRRGADPASSRPSHRAILPSRGDRMPAERPARRAPCGILQPRRRTGGRRTTGGTDWRTGSVDEGGSAATGPRRGCPVGDPLRPRVRPRRGLGRRGDRDAEPAAPADHRRPCASPRRRGPRPGAATGSTVTGAPRSPGARPAARRDLAPVAGAPGRAPGRARRGVTCGPGVRQLPGSVYSAPCVPAFTGDNGGATHRGVTGDTIRIVRRRVPRDGQLPGRRRGHRPGRRRRPRHRAGDAGSGSSRSSRSSTSSTAGTSSGSSTSRASATTPPRCRVAAGRAPASTPRWWPTS